MIIELLWNIISKRKHLKNTILPYEILHLLTTPEDECATTLLMLPFAYPDFEEWYDFVIELEDNILNEMLMECRGIKYDTNNDDDGVPP